ncbi:hypothetical protein K6T82_18415 [Flavobacterium sp. 17A]|uniref:Uncharacterized protein n=1 Tax=Flavobacterium potami TaxID=2872310 RepID=A0A9X1HDC5_9FLAO|nr:hypothetical protein [Flavobacterium potami]MBZ4036751.1 hypothetical protein [Flavobacterium potami]
MYITDLNGCLIEVTDLAKAMQITAEYKEYGYKDKSFSEFDKRQKAYWTDMYEKLTAIKEKATTH